MPTPNDTTTQTTTTTTTTEAPEVKQETNQVEDNGIRLGDMSLDDFMSMDFSDDPKLKDTFSQEHKGLPDYKTILMKHSTEEGRKLISNMRTSYAKKTQELAAARRELELEREQVLREKQALYSGDQARKIQELAATPTTEIDPYTPEGLAKLIEIETAKKMAEMLRPQQQELETQRAIMAAQRFVDAHPEMRSEAFKAKLVPLMTEREDMDLETAYWMVKGQLAKEAEGKQAEEKKVAAVKRVETKEAIKKTTGATNVTTSGAPKGLSPYEYAQWYKANKK